MSIDNLVNKHAVIGNSIDTKIQTPGFFRRICRYGKGAAYAGIVGLAFAGGVKAVKAATYYVNPGDSIQETINNHAVVDGDKIIVAEGTYIEKINFNGKNIILRSTDPNYPETTIINGNQNGYVVTFNSGEDANCVLSGFTITIGYADYGGGIYCENSSPTVSNCILSGNHGESGGMHNAYSNPTLTNCIFKENFVDFAGGGMYNFESNPTLTNCTFSENSADYGGGMFNDEADHITLIHCTFSGNTADFAGGGMYNFESNLTLTNCTFSENSADYGGGMCNDSESEIIDCTFSGNTADFGGGMYTADSESEIIDCTFSGNEAFGSSRSGGGGGGGIYSNFSELLRVYNCLFTGNRAQHGGAGINNRHSNTTLTNCTFSGNSSDYSCNGILNDYSPLTLINCILWGDTPDEIDICYDTPPIITYSNVQGGWPGLGNIDTDPCFVDPGYWDPNGTPEDANDDYWVDGDYHLKSEGWRWDNEREHWRHDKVTSRCIDAGNPGSPLGNELLTIPKDRKHKRGENLRINMGAYGGTEKASMPPYDWALLGDLTNNGKVNINDLGYQIEDWLNSGNELPGNLDRKGIINMIDFALLAEDWLKQTSWYEQ